MDLSLILYERNKSICDVVRNYFTETIIVTPLPLMPANKLGLFIILCYF